MPELPEVETIVRQLKPELMHRTLAAVEALWGKSVELSAPQVEKLKGKTVLDVLRRGKWILLLLDDGDRLAIHLRMTGRLSLSPLAGRKEHLRGEIAFSDGQRLYFFDPRKFGRIRLVPVHEKSWLDEIGVEPLPDNLLETALNGLDSRRSVKAVLLDQSVVAGIGNIYADEALFSAGIHPLRPFCGLTPAERSRLASAVRLILLAAIGNGGSTISDYRDLLGEEGLQQQHHQVYHRQGQACFRCNATILRTRIAGRSTHFCPGCQPEPPSPR